MPQESVVLELALQEALRAQMDAVVRAANADAALLQGSDMQKNQIRNVLNVADESQSLAVVTGFIRYQMGRRSTGDAWRHEDFGSQVISQIESADGLIARQAETVLSSLRDECDKIDPQIDKHVRYELTRYYLGFLHRAFYYGTETKEWDDLRKAGREAQNA